MLSLTDAIEKWNERNDLNDELLFDVMAVVTCHRDESLNSKNGRYRRLGLADSHARAVFRLSDSISSTNFPAEGSVICLYGVSMRKVAQHVELRQDGRKHEGPLWQLMLPHNATGEQRHQNQETARLWTWWQQHDVNAVTLPKCVDRTLGELALTAGMKGHIVAHVCQVQVGPSKGLHKRKAFGSTKVPQVTALLTDSSRKTFASLLDRTGLSQRALERAQRTQELIRFTFVKSTFANGEEIVLLTTHDTLIHPVTDGTIRSCLSSESQASPRIPFSPLPEMRVIISPLYRVNKCRIVPYLTSGQDVHLEIETESVVATYSTVFEVLSCGGDLLIFQALIDEAIPLRWTIHASGVVSQVSLVGFPLSTIE